jgi:Zn-finger protein
MYFKEVCAGKPEFIYKGDNKIKDCSNCTFPHRAENYDKVIAAIRSV